MTHTAEVLSTCIFAAAVFHTLAASFFHQLAHRFPEESQRRNALLLLGEVEVVFGFWAAVLLAALIICVGKDSALHYIQSLNFSEALFVFAVMVVSSTRPITVAARRLILRISRWLPLPHDPAIYWTALIAGPLVGSLITEPAAMTVTAFLLRDRFLSKTVSRRFLYVTVATLFTNISVGGVLTNFAAPPVLMVAQTWMWDSTFMFRTFGWKAILIVLVNASLALALNFRELQSLRVVRAIAPKADSKLIPMSVTIIHLAFLALIVLMAHYPAIFIGLFLYFLGYSTISRKHHEDLRVRESLLVGFFLGGLVVHGGLQGWWLKPLLLELGSLPLFIGTTLLSSFTDNAALTYLGSQVPGVSEAFKYSIVSGAVAGGGLTIIANAANPAGYSILQGSFGTQGLETRALFFAALLPTAVAMIFFWLL